MSPVDYSKKTVTELLATHSKVLDELKQRQVIRSKNNPTGDYAEWLVASKLGLVLEKNSAKGFDARDLQGLRYQIKGRRVTSGNKSTQLGVIRDLEGKDFDFLVAVVFDENWQVHSAAKIPHQVVSLFATYRPHVNGHIMHLRPSVFDNPLVEDISLKLGT
ncbi:MAG: hypothetical protein KKF58_04470 [Gammaproteobacteria bacterium]|nr:hypothetical protein [Gammaproteobacteria bacterium]MDD5472503.1 hypothetical protein [Sideroxydans sp.]